MVSRLGDCLNLPFDARPSIQPKFKVEILAIGLGMNLTELLRQSYHSGHAANVSGAVYEDLRALWPYFAANYQVLNDLNRNSRIVELGAGSGALIAWLLHQGFSNITGVDVSAEEVERSVGRGLPIEHADALEYLSSQNDGSVDVVVLKAVLEHMSRQCAAGLLREVARALTPGGLTIIDVPNMDWLLAGHERYMDLTHETGYTKESLRQLLLLFFEDVQIKGATSVPSATRDYVRIRLLRPLVVGGIRFVLRVLGEGASHVLFECRSIVAVAKSTAR